jgi:hypothetical protein
LRTASAEEDPGEQADVPTALIDTQLSVPGKVSISRGRKGRENLARATATNTKRFFGSLL